MCAAGTARRRRPRACWYELVSKGLAGLLTEVEGDDGSMVRRLENVPTVFAAKAAASPAAMAPPPLPDWAV